MEAIHTAIWNVDFPTCSGAGPIGLVTLLAAHAAGAAPIVITDVYQSRLDFAKKLVPRVRTLLVDPKAAAKDTASMLEGVAGSKIQFTLECTGFETSIASAIYVRLGEARLKRIS